MNKKIGKLVLLAIIAMILGALFPRYESLIQGIAVFVLMSMYLDMF